MASSTFRRTVKFFVDGLAAALIFVAFDLGWHRWSGWIGGAVVGVLFGGVVALRDDRFELVELARYLCRRYRL